MAQILIGYDVEAQPDSLWPTAQFLSTMQALHEGLDVPATLFIVGQTLEANVEALRPLVDHPLFDLQQHTYSHLLLKTVVMDSGTGVELMEGGSLAQIAQEVTKTQRLFRELLGVECIGLTGPYGYYRGLQDRPDILRVLYAAGIRFTRTDARNGSDWQPVPLDRQPYWYDLQGVEILEFPIQGYQDVYRRRACGWKDLDCYFQGLQGEIEEVAERDLILDYCQHDWSSIREDPEMSLTRRIIRYAQGQGIQFGLYREVWQEMCAKRMGRVVSG